MGAIFHVRTALNRVWKRRIVKVGVVLFLIFEFLTFVRFDKFTSIITNSNKTAATSKNLTDSYNLTLIEESSKAPKMSGFLNLHLWSDTCAKNLDILCNFPMFPRAPDNRLALNKTVIARNLKQAKAIRLFGFIDPIESGVFFFMVKFCIAEVYLSYNKNWKEARQILSLDVGKFPENKSDSQVSSAIDLVAGEKYFIDIVAICVYRINKLQLLWKTPSSSGFEILNSTFLSTKMDDNSLSNLSFYDEDIPDSQACALRKNDTTYFKSRREISYLSHEEVKNVLPNCEYKPSYILNRRVSKYEAVFRHVVHSFIFPFPKHHQVSNFSNRIYPLGESEAREVVNILMEALRNKSPR